MSPEQEDGHQSCHVHKETCAHYFLNVNGTHTASTHNNRSTALWSSTWESQTAADGVGEVAEGKGWPVGPAFSQNHYLLYAIPSMEGKRGYTKQNSPVEQSLEGQPKVATNGDCCCVQHDPAAERRLLRGIEHEPSAAEHSRSALWWDRRKLAHCDMGCKTRGDPVEAKTDRKCGSIRYSVPQHPGRQIT